MVAIVGQHGVCAPSIRNLAGFWQVDYYVLIYSVLIVFVCL